MRKTPLSFYPFIGALALVPSAAFAHTGLGQTAGFIHGFAHPFAGLDHVLAMVLVGMLACRIGGRALIAVPASFIALMAVGGALGMTGVEVPFVETGIALSIVVLGAALASGIRQSAAAAAALAGAFAIFHGHAHGAEMPMNAESIAYGFGFIMATAILHGAGIGLGFCLYRLDVNRERIFTRLAGGTATAIGLTFLAGCF